MTAFLSICTVCAIGLAGIPYALPKGMDLLGRVCAVVGISVVLTVLLLVLYQDDGAPAQATEPQPVSISEVAAEPVLATP